MLPVWLEPLFLAEEMRAADRFAIEEAGVPGPVLMERAGLELARAVLVRAGGGPVALVCGKGNNGGDGFVAARLLREQGLEARVLRLAAVEEHGGDAAQALARLGRSEAWDLSRLEGCTVAVDCVLGTGTSGAPRGAAAEAIAALRGFGGAVIACDVPSGVDASTGEVAGEAVRAERTVTFAAAKPGLWIAPGKQHAGAVEVTDIGLPRDAPGASRLGLLTDAVVREIPLRGADATKFSSGHVLVCGGAPGMSGAVRLAAEAALRAGAGYVTAAVPAAVRDLVDLAVAEAVVPPTLDDAGAIVAEAGRRGGAVVLGCGAGREPEAVERLRAVAADAAAPLVLDADGLNAHAGRLEDLAARTCPTVLTPHGGELARVLEADSDAVRARRLDLAREAARRAEAVVVLKGDDTLVVEPGEGGRVAVSPGGAPALATAGTGDVLSGTIGALLAKGLEPWTAACAGVMLHRAAGLEAARTLGASEGVVASDVVAALGRVPRR